MRYYPDQMLKAYNTIYTKNEALWYVATWDGCMHGIITAI